ncbi:MAG: mdmB [Gemmatimonadetes bacterium]|nr:mdmB [Gemmatimonadota bacterium]
MPDAMPRTAAPHLRALTGLRFVAATQVVLYHVYAPGAGRAPQWVRALAGSGYVGVGLFFVLSGFVLAYNYLGPVEEGRVTRREFWTARLARVYPVYLLGLVAGMPVFARWMLHVNPLPAALGWIAGVTGASLALVQGWAPQTACALNCPGWSLSAEAFFYLCFPFLVAPVLRLSARQALAAAAVLWLVALAFPAAYLALRPDGLGALTTASHGVWLMALKFNPLARLPEFAIGVLAGRLFLDGALPRLRGAWMEGAAMAAIVAVLLASPALPYPLVHNGLLAPLFATLVLLLARGEGVVSKLLSGRWMEMLGGASYALYILHLPLNDWTGRAMDALDLDVTSPAGYALVFLAGATLVSIAVFRWVEEPARRALRRRLSAPRPARVEAPAPAFGGGALAEAGD